MHYKDAILDNLASRVNVAQFVSFDPDLNQRFARVLGFEPNYCFESLREAISTILRQSSETSVNVRSFDPSDPKSKEFKIGFKDPEVVENHVRRLAAEGLYTIVNETIDPCDSGVSGVLLGDVIEFSPDATPRCVDSPGFGTAALPRQYGLKLLKTVYGFPVELDYPPKIRVEFSIHPIRRGFLHKHTVIWEIEEVGTIETKADIRWPNNFSRLIGDKAYGLLIASLIGVPVPRATVISRRIAPFQFGDSTSTSEIWIRTCPSEQVPGKFSTYRGWRDPFELMAEEDPKGEAIASILAQVGVDASYSGSLVTTEQEELPKEESIIIEGTQGYGDEFMLGRKKKVVLPDKTLGYVKSLYNQVAGVLGPVRMEWVADEKQAWVVQLHKGATKSTGHSIYPGVPSKYHKFYVEQDRPLEALRELVQRVKGKDEGIIVVGDVGITSHFGDVLRSAEIPSKIELPSAAPQTSLEKMY